MASILDNTLLVGDRILEGVNYSPGTGLSGSILGTSSISGTMTVTRQIAGSLSGTSSITSDLVLTAGLSGGLVGESSITGNLSPIGRLQLSGTITGTSNLNGAFVGGVSTLVLRGPLRIVQVSKYL